MAGFTNNLSLRKKPQTQREKRNEVREQAKQAATKAKTSNKRPRTITASPVLDYGTPSSKAGNTAQSESSSRKYSNVRKPSFSAAYVKSEQESKKANPTVKSSGINQTSLGNPKGLRDLEKRKSKSGVSSASAKQTGKSGSTNPDNTRDIIAQGFTEVKTPTAKKRWNEEEVLKERREAAKAQGKGNWNAEEEMKKRREAAKANGKGNWNAEEEMKKRRETAKANGKGTWNAEEEMRKRREAAAAKKKGGRA